MVIKGLIGGTIFSENDLIYYSDIQHAYIRKNKNKDRNKNKTKTRNKSSTKDWRNIFSPDALLCKLSHSSAKRSKIRAVVRGEKPAKCQLNAGRRAGPTPQNLCKEIKPKVEI